MPFEIKKEAPRRILVTMGQADKEIGNELRNESRELPLSERDDGAATETGDKPDSPSDGDKEGTSQQEGAGGREGKASKQGGR